MVTPAPLNFTDLLDVKCEWPEKGDRLFREPLHALDRTTANVSGWSRNLMVFSADYKQSADILMNTLAAGETQPDLIAWAVLYLYRHAVELSFKFALFQGRLALGEATEIITGHKLDVFLRELSQQSERLFPGEKESLDAFGALVSELHEIDPTGEVFRYPYDLGGSNFQIRFDFVDLDRFRQGIEKILNFLDGHSNAAGELASATP